MLITKHSRRPLESLAHKEFWGVPCISKVYLYEYFILFVCQFQPMLLKSVFNPYFAQINCKILLLSKFAQSLVHFLQRIGLRRNLICLDESFIKETETVIFYLLASTTFL